MGRETASLGYSSPSLGCCFWWKAHLSSQSGDTIVMRAENRCSLINWPNSTLASLRDPLLHGKCLEKIGAWFAYRLLNVIAIAVDIFSTLTALVLAIITIPWPEKHDFFFKRTMTSSVNAVAGLIELFTLELQCCGIINVL